VLLIGFECLGMAYLLGHDHINCGEMLVFSGMMQWCKERLNKTGTSPNPLPTYPHLSSPCRPITALRRQPPPLLLP
jgi:hypothetical protein